MYNVEVIREGGRGDQSMKWFEFDQINSGGYFIDNDDVCETVFIQARNAREAVNMAEILFEPYSEYCGCCGERWSYYVDDSDGTVTPMIYGESIYETTAGMFREKCILHYADGRVERVKFKKE